MNRSKRMEPVAGLADEQADEAAKVLAGERRRLEEHQARLEQLLMFRNEYQSQFRASAELGMDGHRMRDFKAFIARIDSAIEQQREAVTRAEQTAQARRGQWTQAWGRSRALNKVVERYRNEERRAQDRREQNEVEELGRGRRPAGSED